MKKLQFSFYGKLQSPNFLLFSVNAYDLFLVVASASLANSVRHGQRAALAALY